MNSKTQGNSKRFRLKSYQSTKNMKTPNLSSSKEQKDLTRKIYVCNHCKRTGHKIYNCRYLKRERKEKQKQQDDEKEEKTLLLHEKIDQRLNELAQSVAHILSSFTRFTETVQNRLSSFASRNNEGEEALKTPSVPQELHSSSPITHPPKLPLSEPLDFTISTSVTHLPEVNRIDQKNEEIENDLNEFQQLFELENTLKPLKINLQRCVLFKHPKDNAQDLIDEGKDPRQILFTRDSKSSRFFSVLEKLPSDSISYTKIRRQHEIIDDDEKEWFLTFEKRIQQKTAARKNARKTKKNKKFIVSWIVQQKKSKEISSEIPV